MQERGDLTNNHGTNRGEADDQKRDALKVRGIDVFLVIEQFIGSDNSEFFINVGIRATL